MEDPGTYSLHSLRLTHERHVVQARQRARDIAALLGFDHQEQIRLATAASELARNAFRYATGGIVEFLVRDLDQQLFVIHVTDNGPGIPHLQAVLNGQYASKTGMGVGIIGSSRLMDHFEIVAPREGTRVEAGKRLPSGAPRLDTSRWKQILKELANSKTADPFDEVERQNQELLKTLAELEAKQGQLSHLNQELQDTNRGVVALYAELDQQADDLKRVSDLKTSFLSNLSHEFRTPLNSITSLSRLLLNRADGELTGEQEKQVQYIQRSAADLTELIDDLLDLAKVEAGKIEVRPRRFEVSDVFGGLRGVLKPLLVGNNVELQFEIEPDIPPLLSDEGKIAQILRNLISNALKFTHRGHVRLAAKRHLNDEMVSFSVADTGVGIAPDNLPRIFDEFVQLENDLQGREKGTGLGLPISRRLAELLGGTLSVQSELGIGSTFTLAVPIHYAKNPSPELVEAEELREAEPCILFIEDSREATFIYRSAMKDSKYRLEFVSTLHEARLALKMTNPALVVLDRLLDRVDSLVFVKEMRAGGFRDPILVVSVVDDPAAALQAGADAFLAKPISPFTLLSTIRELVEKKAARTLVLVDDDEVTRYLLAETLAKLGYRTLEARSGREAVRILNENKVDGVFLDIMMPGVDGFEVLREIRTRSNKRDVPIIVHSSKTISNAELSLISEFKAVVYSKRDMVKDLESNMLRSVLNSVGVAQ